MFKKILIIILVLLILGSIGLIAYLSLSQRNISFNFIANLFKVKEVAPVVIRNPFPIAASSMQAGDQNNSTNTNPVNNQNPKGDAYIESINIIGLRNYNQNEESFGIFINQENGHIYTIDQQNNLKRKTNTTLTNLAAAKIGVINNKGYLIVQQTKGLSSDNYIGDFDLTTVSTDEPTKLNYTKLNFPILSIAISPNNQKIAYLIPEGERSALYLNDWSLSKPQKIWVSELTNWQIHWPEENTLLVADKASFDYPGIAYLFNLKNNTQTKILNKINGLTILASPQVDKLIYSKSLLSGFSLYLYDIKTKESSLLNLSTLPEKCTWANNETLYCAVPRSIPTARYPDDWYQGKITFADDLWEIKFPSKETKKISIVRGNYDFIQTTVNLRNNWLYVIDKSTQKLQAFNLSDN